MRGSPCATRARRDPGRHRRCLEIGSRFRCRPDSPSRPGWRQSSRRRRRIGRSHLGLMGLAVRIWGGGYGLVRRQERRRSQGAGSAGGCWPSAPGRMVMESTPTSLQTRPGNRHTAPKDRRHLFGPERLSALPDLTARLYRWQPEQEARRSRRPAADPPRPFVAPSCRLPCSASGRSRRRRLRGLAAAANGRRPNRRRHPRPNLDRTRRPGIQRRHASGRSTC